MTNLLKLFSLQDTANTVAEAANGKYKFSIKHTQDPNTPGVTRHNNNITIHLPDQGSDMKDEDFEKIRAHVYRTVLRYTDGDGGAYVKKWKEDPMRQNAFSLVEQARLEHLGANRYLGDKSDFGHEVVRSSRAQRTHQSGELDEDSAKLLAINAASLRARQDFSVDSFVAAKEALDSMPESVAANFKKIQDAGLLDFNSTKMTAAERTDAIYKLLWEDAPDQPQGGEGDDEGDGEGQPGKDGRPKKGKGKGEPGEGEGEGEGEAEGKGEGKDGKGKKSMMSELLNPHREDHDDPKREPMIGSGGIGGYYRGGTILTPKDYIARYSMKHKKFESGVKTGRYILDYMQHLEKNARRGAHIQEGVSLEGGKALARQMQRLLLVKSESEWVGGEKAGKVNRPALYKLALPVVGDGEWNSRVFRKQHKNDILDIAVSVAIDCSGSMCGGDKMGGAVSAAYLLNEAISRGLRIPLEILFFTDYDQPFHMIAKAFDERVSPEEMLDRASRCFNVSSGNADPEAVMDAYWQVLQRKEKRKAIIVVSDGQPAGGGGTLPDGTIRSGAGPDTMRAVITNMVEKDKRVELHAIGLCDNSVTRYYKNNQVVHKASDLPTAMLNLFKKVINK